MTVFQSIHRKFFPHRPDREDIHDWRRHVLSIILSVGVVLGSIAVVPSTILALGEGLWSVAIIDVIVMAWALIILGRRSWSFHARAWNFCALVYLLGASFLFTLGPLSQIYLMAFPVFAALLLGLMPALFALVLNAVTLLGVGYLANANLTLLGFEGHSLVKWIVITVNFSVVNSMITIASAVLLHGLESSLERKRASEERHRLLFESSRDALMTLAPPSWRFTGANQATLEMFRAASTLAFTKHDPLDLSPERQPDGRLSAEKAREAIATAVREGEFAFEWEHRRLDGSPFPANVLLTRMNLGGEMFLQATVRDVTEQKHAEARLRAAEEQFRGLVEQHITGIYIIQNGVFVYANPRFAEIFGYEPKEIIGMDVPALVAARDRDLVLEKMRMRFSGEVTNIEYEFTGQRKNGTLVDIGVHGTISVHGGKPAILGVLQDISAKKHAEEQIERYVAQIENAFMSTVQVVTTLGEMRDPYTAGHQRRVAEIAVAIGAELGFDARRQEGLRVAGYLHDVGKIRIPSEILSKPGKLSPAEFQLVQGHAQASYDVLKDVQFPWPVAEVALQHHERIDGSGYPQGLKGEAILFEARIMAVADVVEAMSSHRPYRAGLGIDAALAEIERAGGTSYDSVVVNACQRLFREKGYVLPV